MNHLPQYLLNLLNKYKSLIILFFKRYNKFLNPLFFFLLGFIFRGFFVKKHREVITTNGNFDIENDFYILKECEDIHVINNLKQNFDNFDCCFVQKEGFFIDKSSSLLVHFMQQNAQDEDKSKIVFKTITRDLKVLTNSQASFSIEASNKTIFSRGFRQCKEIKIPLAGKFVSNEEMIYRVSHERMNFILVTFYQEFMLVKEWEKINQNMQNNYLKEIPMGVVEFDELGVIQNTSPYFYKMFNIENKIERIQDFFYEIRGKITPDSMSFHEKNNEFLNEVKHIDGFKTEILSTLDDRIFGIWILKKKNIIMCYGDITNMCQYSPKNEILKEFGENVFNHLNEKIFIFKNENQLIFANNEIKSQSFQEIIKDNPDNYMEIKMSDNYRVLLLNNLINMNINKIKNKIQDWFSRLSNLISIINNNTMKEYDELNKFITINFEHTLKVLTIECSKPNLELFNFTELLDSIYEKMINNITIKNLVISIRNNKNEFELYGEKLLSIVVIENLILLAYNFPKNEKTLFIFTENKDIILKLTNLPKDEMSNYKNLLEINSRKIVIQREMIGNSISIIIKIKKK